MIREKEFKSDTFQSQLLSGQCGFDVTLSFTGSVTVKTFPKRPVGPQDLTLVILAIVFSAGNKTVRFQQVQTTITQVKPDAVTSISATATFAGKTVEFTGVQKIDLETGETTLESHNVSGAAREVICERLRA
jgi:hypothetical protein